jgi:hypothetical protein
MGLFILLFIVSLFSIGGYIMWVEFNWNEYEYMNSLYKCINKECERNFRVYQLMLIESVKGEEVCPHCLHNEIADSYKTNKEKEESVWIRDHFDSPRITLKEIKKVCKMISKLEKIIEDKKAVDNFKEYQTKSMS